MKRVAILISGGGSNMVALAKSMTGAHPARCVLVLSNDPQAGGLAKARDMGIATAAVDYRDFPNNRSGFEGAIHAILEDHRPDIICLAGFMRQLTGGFTDQWAGRMINIHPSLLPKYKGLHTHARALEAGDAVHGCSVHEVTAALDDGPVLGQAQVPVLAGDTPATLATRVLVQEHILYPAVLRRFCVGERSPLFLQS